MSERALKVAAWVVIPWMLACNSGSPANKPAATNTPTTANKPSAATTPSESTSSAAKPGHHALPAKPGVPYRLTNIHSETSLSLVTGSGDLSFARDDKLQKNTFEVAFKLTGTAAVAGHRLLVHHACRFGNVIVAREVMHEDVSTGPGTELKLDAMKAGQSGTAKGYHWPVPPDLGMATACESRFYDVPLDALSKELKDKTTETRAINAVRIELGTFCATAGQGAAGITQAAGPTLFARPCSEQELPRTTDKGFTPPKVQWHNEGLLGWYAITVTEPVGIEERAWQRLVCRAGAEQSSATGWLQQSRDIAPLLVGESAVGVFDAASPFMAKEDASCELALGIDKQQQQDLMRATAKASYCISRNNQGSLKEGPCPPAAGK